MKKYLRNIILAITVVSVVMLLGSVAAFADETAPSVVATAAAETDAAVLDQSGDNVIDASELGDDSTDTKTAETDSGYIGEDATDTVGTDETTAEETTTAWYQTQPASTIGLVLAIVLPIVAIIGIILFAPKGKNKNKKK